MDGVIEATEQVKARSKVKLELILGITKALLSTDDSITIVWSPGPKVRLVVSTLKLFH